MRLLRYKRGGELKNLLHRRVQSSTVQSSTVPSTPHLITACPALPGRDLALCVVLSTHHPGGCWERRLNGAERDGSPFTPPPPARSEERSPLFTSQSLPRDMISGETASILAWKVIRLERAASGGRRLLLHKRAGGS